MAGEGTWNPWKMTAIGMALVMVTALVTGLVVASWRAPQPESKAPAPAATAQPATPAPAAPAATAPHATPRHVASATQHSVPTQAAVDACNREATARTPKEKTVEVVKDAAVGAVLGAAVGAAGGAIAGGGSGAGKGAAIGGVVGAGGGTLYGLNENRKNDERYRAAYAACMRARGYAS